MRRLLTLQRLQIKHVQISALLVDAAQVVAKAALLAVEPSALALNLIRRSSRSAALLVLWPVVVALTSLLRLSLATRRAKWVLVLVKQGIRHLRLIRQSAMQRLGAH
jgi:hypothetical protein